MSNVGYPLLILFCCACLNIIIQMEFVCIVGCLFCSVPSHFEIQWHYGWEHYTFGVFMGFSMKMVELRGKN